MEKQNLDSPDPTTPRSVPSFSSPRGHMPLSARRCHGRRYGCVVAPVVFSSKELHGLDLWIMIIVVVGAGSPCFLSPLKRIDEGESDRFRRGLLWTTGSGDNDTSKHLPPNDRHHTCTNPTDIRRPPSDGIEKGGPVSAT